MIAMAGQILSGPLKRSIMARIASLDLGDDVQVSANLLPEPDRKCVYGGRVRWAQTEVLDQHATVFTQTITFEVRVRVVDLGDDIDGTEQEAERILSAVVAGVVSPSLVKGIGSLTASSGDQDPTVTAAGPEPMVMANFAVTFTASITVGGR